MAPPASDSSLQLSIVPHSQYVDVQVSWSGVAPTDVIEYFVFYYKSNKKVKSVSSTSTSFQIPNLTNDIVYNFRASAFKAGFRNGQLLSETAVIQQICASPPQAPTGLIAVISTQETVISNEIDLSFTASVCSPYYRVLNYKLYQSSDDDIYELVETIETTATQVMELENGTNYYFKVSAVNAMGESELSGMVSAIPLDLPTVPLELVVKYDPSVQDAVATGYQSVDLAWSPPNSDGGSAIQSYTIQYSKDPSFQVNVVSVTANSTSETIQDSNLLLMFADVDASIGWYYFRVKAVSMSGLSSGFSAPSTIVANSLPHAVENVTSTNLDESGLPSGGVVTLSWQYTVDDSTPLLGYVVSFIDDSDNLKSYYVNDVSHNPSFTISELANGNSYDVSVVALNMLGSGEAVDITQLCSGLPDAPLAPVLVHDDEAITISFEEPRDEGMAITGYNVYRSTNGSAVTKIRSNITDMTVTDTGLVNGTTYFYSISAINANGEGLLSDEASEYPSTVPSQLREVNVVNSIASAEGNELTVSITQDPSEIAMNGGSVILNFVVSRSSDRINFDSVTTIEATDELNYEFVDQGVENGTMYSYKVCAVNRDGSSFSIFIFCANLAQQSDSIMCSGLPDAPVITSIVNLDQTIGEQLTVSWDAPFDEGSDIISYNLYRDSGLLVSDVTSPFTDDNGLINGKIYSYQVSAINSYQVSSVSESSSGLPEVVEGLTAVHGNSLVTLSWTALHIASGGSNVTPSDQGSAITNYNIFVFDGNENPLFMTGNNGTSMTIGELTNGMVYNFKVSAVNENGEGEKCDFVSCTPSRSPDVVRNVQVIPVNSGFIIDWQPPANDESGLPNGGLPYTYTLTIYDVTAGTQITGTDGLTRTLMREYPGYVNGHEYRVTIVALNGVDNANAHAYYAFTIPLPEPVSIHGLSWDHEDEEQVSLQFSYDTVQYRVTKFIVVYFDENSRAASGVALFDSTDLGSNGTIDMSDPSNYVYRIHLNGANTFNEMFDPLHQMDIIIIAQNNVNVGPASNIVQVN